MLENLTNNLITYANKANPINWERQTLNRAINATVAIAFTAMALYALANIPGASAKEINYNAIRTAQDVVEGKEHVVANYLSGEFIGRATVDGLSAFEEVRKQGGTLGEAVVTGVFKTVLSKAYENCLENANGFFNALACQVLKP